MIRVRAHGTLSAAQRSPIRAIFRWPPLLSAFVMSSRQGDDARPKVSLARFPSNNSQLRFFSGTRPFISTRTPSSYLTCMFQIADFSARNVPAMRTR